MNPDTEQARARSERPDPDEGFKPTFWQQRLGLAGLRYPIPAGARTITYSLGALTLTCFVILVVTGLWISQFYNPNPAAAHDSVLYLIARAPFGDFARSLHYWAASAMVVSIVAHIGWVFYSRGYRAPREITWYAGLGVAGLVFLMVVTGTVLRYDQEGYEALAHFLAGADLTGPLGFFFGTEFTLSTPVLARIFTLHTSALPLILVALLGLHLWLVRMLGLSAPGPRTELFSTHLRLIGGAGLLLFAGLLVLAVLFPTGIGHEPVPGYEITKPFWPLLWIYALESMTGMWAVVWAPLAAFVFLAAVPLLDRKPDAVSRTLRVLGIVLLATLVALGLWAAISPPQQHLGM